MSAIYTSIYSASHFHENSHVFIAHIIGRIILTVGSSHQNYFSLGNIWKYQASWKTEIGMQQMQILMNTNPRLDTFFLLFASELNLTASSCFMKEKMCWHEWQFMGTEPVCLVGPWKCSLPSVTVNFTTGLWWKASLRGTLPSVFPSVYFSDADVIHFCARGLKWPFLLCVWGFWHFLYGISDVPKEHKFSSWTTLAKATNKK